MAASEECLVSPSVSRGSRRAPKRCSAARAISVAAAAACAGALASRAPSALRQWSHPSPPLLTLRGDSCAGHCGGWADSCWCDDGCERHGNCCQDYAAKCGESCPRCGGYTCDEWIQWDARYTCESLEREYACNCRGCASCSGPSPRPNSTAAVLELFDQQLHPEARCLDGSMAGYYFRPGRADKYLIFFVGGGWCYDAQCGDPTKAGTLRDCRRRARGRLGSSAGWPREEDAYLTGMLSADPRQNPVFHDWTLVYVPYCDGASFTGDKVVEGLFFKGSAIRRALVAALKTHTGIASADQVVLSGGSAGASAVFWHADSIAKELDLGPQRVFALPDAGFFLDLPDKDGIDCWPAQMRSLFDTIDGYGDLQPACLARFPDAQWKCLFPEYYADLIETPTLVLHSFYDKSEIEATLRLTCSPDGTPPCSGRQLELFKRLRSQHLEAWEPLVRKNASGVWAPACVAHTMSWGSWTDRRWEVPAGSGDTMAAVVARWLDGDDADGKHFIHLDVAWPLNQPCAHWRAEPQRADQPSDLGAQPGRVAWFLDLARQRVSRVARALWP